MALQCSVLDNSRWANCTITAWELFFCQKGASFLCIGQVEAVEACQRVGNEFFFTQELHCLSATTDGLGQGIGYKSGGI